MPETTPFTSKTRTVAMCAASAAVGAVLTVSVSAAASPHAHAPAAKHYLHNGYVLTQVPHHCPTGSVPFDATLKASVQGGHQRYQLCQIK
jgi:hypothetical protein